MAFEFFVFFCLEGDEGGRLKRPGAALETHSLDIWCVGDYVERNFRIDPESILSAVGVYQVSGRITAALDLRKSPQNARFTRPRLSQ